MEEDPEARAEGAAGEGNLLLAKRIAKSSTEKKVH
jgi:hypothetical protein